MNQTHLLELLTTAAASGSDAELGSIHATLRSACGHQHPVVGNFMSRLFDSATKHRPDLLPTLFPAFALLCGDRDPAFDFADIDWTLMPPASEKPHKPRRKARKDT
ncbi:MAG: hypothetical protein HY369_05065 [Candidatus Aenigmarchaeota archaeon]|nr:hypothetical protein [Candidatus Aenigmarchaeota archaeon]